jgi:hypothetical protein
MKFSITIILLLSVLYAIDAYKKPNNRIPQTNQNVTVSNEHIKTPNHKIAISKRVGSLKEHVNNRNKRSSGLSQISSNINVISPFSGVNVGSLGGMFKNSTTDAMLKPIITFMEKLPDLIMTKVKNLFDDKYNNLAKHLEENYTKIVMVFLIIVIILTFIITCYCVTLIRTFKDNVLWLKSIITCSYKKKESEDESEDYDSD